MTTNTGKDYERLTHRVFKALHEQQSVKNVRIERDTTLVGHSGVSRQVDVFWEFEAVGILHRVIVECKDLSKPVSPDVVTELIGRLNDLPGHRGAIVARRGFSSGAKRLAKAHQIVLYELRPPKDSDWTGYITGADIHMHFRLPRLNAAEFLWDAEWNAKERQRAGLSTLEVPFSLNGGTTLERDDGTTVTLDDLVNQVLGPLDVGPAQWRQHTFSEPVYVPTKAKELPRLRALGIRTLVEVGELKRTVKVRLREFVSLILKDVSKGTFTVLDAQGLPLTPGNPQPRRMLASDETQGSSEGTGEKEQSS